MLCCLITLVTKFIESCFDYFTQYTRKPYLSIRRDAVMAAQLHYPSGIVYPVTRWKSLATASLTLYSQPGILMNFAIINNLR